MPLRSSRHHRCNRLSGCVEERGNPTDWKRRTGERSRAITYPFRARLPLSNPPAHLLAHAAMRFRIALAIRTRSSPTGYGKPRHPA